MYVCYKIKNKQKEWHPATKPLNFYQQSRKAAAKPAMDSKAMLHRK
jgi:hypothetical protein